MGNVSRVPASAWHAATTQPCSQGREKCGPARRALRRATARSTAMTATPAAESARAWSR